MKKLLSEIITSWWIEVDTKLVNPKSKEAINGLKKVLREDFKFDSDVIDYVVEMVRSTPTNFYLGGKTSGIDVGKNQTAVSAQLHPVWDDDEEDDDEDDVYNNNDGELSEWDVTLLDGLDEEEESETEEKDEKAAAEDDIKKNALTALEKDKLKKEAIDDELLKTKLTNPTTGNPNQVSTLLGKKKSDPSAYSVAKKFLGDKGVSDDEIESAADSKTDEKDNMSIESEVDRSKFDEKEKDHKDNPNGPTRNEIVGDLNNGNLDVLSEYQNGLVQNREKGIAGAGGPVASEGESKYCSAVDTDFDKWDSENKDEIDTMVSKFVDNTKSADENRTAKHLGLDPNSDEFNTYLAKREVWSNQQLENIKSDKDSVFYKKGKKGFNGKDVAYKEWMQAAYDGAQSTKQLLKESKIDTSKPHKTIQSTDEVDQAVEAHLEDMVKNSKSPEDKKYAETQLKNFRKFKSYHDTYVIGKDANDRTTYMGISNKKDDQLRDPQNNTTPKKRFNELKKKYGQKVAENVTKSLQKNIEIVSDVKQNSVKSASDIPINDDYVAICDTKEMKPYLQTLRDNGKFRDYVKAKGMNPDTMSTSELLEQMNNHSKQLVADGIRPSYAPYGKIALKVGEFSSNPKFRRENSKLNFDNESIGMAQNIKNNEKNAVKNSHESVVRDFVEADKPDGYSDDNPDADNGPHQQGYIGGVLDACHIDTYIDMDSDDGMLLQMGINSVKPSMVKNCVAERSGFKGNLSTSEGRNALKEHLRKRCRVTPGGDKITITDNGKQIDLFEDSWRTAGSSQKVASGFGKSMRTCLQNKAAK